MLDLDLPCPSSSLTLQAGGVVVSSLCGQGVNRRVQDLQVEGGTLELILAVSPFSSLGRRGFMVRVSTGPRTGDSLVVSAGLLSVAGAVLLFLVLLLLFVTVVLIRRSESKARVLARGRRVTWRGPLPPSGMALGRRLGNLYSQAQTVQSQEPVQGQDIGQPPSRPLPLVPDVREDAYSRRRDEFKVYESVSSASSVFGDTMVSPPPRPGWTLVPSPGHYLSLQEVRVEAIKDNWLKRAGSSEESSIVENTSEPIDGNKTPGSSPCRYNFARRQDQHESETRSEYTAPLASRSREPSEREGFTGSRLAISGAKACRRRRLSTWMETRQRRLSSWAWEDEEQEEEVFLPPAIFVDED